MISAGGLKRIGMFFVLNGLATIFEEMIWGHKQHWVKAVLAWSFEISVSTWTAEAVKIPNGLSKIPWQEMCDIRLIM